MSSSPVRVLVVDADPGEGGALLARLEGIEGVEVVGVARNRRTALAEAEITQLDVLLVDLMLPGYRSLDIVRHVTSTDSQIRILALGTEVWGKGPDLRTDGLHGILAPQVLGFRARPVLLYDLDEKQEPLGALPGWQRRPVRAL